MRIIIFAGVLGSLLMTPFAALGETLVPSAVPSVLITEVAWAGSTKSDADEWLELANVSGTPVDLSGWILEGATGSTPLTLPQVSLGAYTTYLVSNYERGNIKSALDVDVQLVTSSVSLPNSGLHLVLKDASGVVRDSVSGNSFGSSGTARASMERTGESAASWKTATTASGLIVGSDFGTPGSIQLVPMETGVPVTETPSAEIPPNTGAIDVPISETPPVPPNEIPDVPVDTPAETGEPNIKTTETPTSSSDQEEPTITVSIPYSHYALTTPPVDPPGFQFHDIIITEFDTSNEWVEYRNETNFHFQLEGLSLEDASGRSFPLSGVLTAHSYGVARLRSGTLNNDGDVVRLRDGGNRTIDVVRYGSAGGFDAPGKGQTASRIKISADSSADFALSMTATPGGVNIVTKPKEITHSAVVLTASEAAEAEEEPAASTVLTALALASTTSASTVKTSTYKLTLTGPSTLYANQGTEFRAVTTPLLETPGYFEWYADGTLVGDGGSGSASAEIVFAEAGVHVLSARVRDGGSNDGNTGRIIAEASRTFTVRAAPLQNEAGTNRSAKSTTSATKTATAATKKSASAKGSASSISGIVIAQERIMGTRKVLLENGVILYLKAGKLPVIAPGDMVKASGKLNTAGTTFTASVVRDIAVTGHAETVEAALISAADVSDEYLNRLVRITGVVGRVQGKEFVISGEEDITAYWKIGASLPAGLVQPGAEVEVTGVLVLKSNEWTLMPRGAEDVRLITAAPPVAASAVKFEPKKLASTGSIVALAIVALVLALLLFHFIREKFLKPKTTMEYETETT